MRHRQGLRSA